MVFVLSETVGDKELLEVDIGHHQVAGLQFLVDEGVEVHLDCDDVFASHDEVQFLEICQALCSSVLPQSAFNQAQREN